MPGPYNMLVSIPPKMSTSDLWISERQKCFADISKWGNIKFAYRNREFWCKGYYVDTVGKEYESDKRKYSRPTAKRQGKRSISNVCPARYAGGYLFCAAPLTLIGIPPLLESQSLLL